ncbi:MAG: pyridoxal phosphate-dependent aminotransferase [Mogibacterium sp.]|nr:pyridoxal phosphate-dependent aminotransferase [Mogibacterium sp.]
MEEFRELEFCDRRGTDSLKWDALESMFGREDLLAAWVADMDLRAPSCVREAMERYAQENLYGYYRVPGGFYDSFTNWMKQYHDYTIEKEWIRFTPGVVPAIYWLIQILTDVDDAVAIMPPVYYPFGNAIRDTARTIVDIPLIEENGRYRMDLELFEEKIVKKKIRLFILCSPHNPVGRVWTAEELRAVLDLCRKHGVYVIADEIHHDLILGGCRHVTAATVGRYESILVTLTSASKTFNLAGCQNAFAILPNQAIRSKFDGFVRRINMQQGANFGYIAYKAAFEGGRPWLEEVLRLIESNYHLLEDGLDECLPAAVLSPLEGTYLAWIDLKAYLEGQDVERIMRDECRIAVDLGEWFYNDDYSGNDYHIRVNLATSPDNVRELVRRLSVIA